MWPSKTRPATFFVVDSRRTAAWTSSNAFGRTHRNLSLRQKPQGARSEHVQDFQRLKWQRNAKKVFGQNTEVATDSWWKVKTPFWDILRPTHSLLVLFLRDFTSKIHPVQTSYPIHYCILAILARWGPPAALPHAPQAKVPLRRVHFCPTESLSKCDSMWFELQSTKCMSSVGKLCANPQIPFFCCAGSESTRWTS